MPEHTRTIPREVPDDAAEGGRKRPRGGMGAGYIGRRPRETRHDDFGNPQRSGIARNHEFKPKVLVARQDADHRGNDEVGRERHPNRILLPQPAPDPANESSPCRRQEPAHPTHSASPRSHPATATVASASRCARQDRSRRHDRGLGAGPGHRSRRDSALGRDRGGQPRHRGGTRFPVGARSPRRGAGPAHGVVARADPRWMAAGTRLRGRMGGRR